MDNPLLVMNVMKYLPGKIHCIDTVLLAIEERILVANLSARNVKGHSLGKRVSPDTKWWYMQTKTKRNLNVEIVVRSLAVSRGREGPGCCHQGVPLQPPRASHSVRCQDLFCYQA